MGQQDIRIVQKHGGLKRQVSVSKAIGERALETAKEKTSITLNKAVTAPRVNAPKILPASPDTTMRVGQTWQGKQDVKTKVTIVQIVAPFYVLLANAIPLSAGEMTETWAISMQAFDLKYDLEE